VSTELARTERAEVALAAPVPARMSMNAKVEYVRTLAHSKMLPNQYVENPANLLWAVEYAEMIGVHPIEAVTGIHVIEGKPSASSALISALVRRAGHRLRVTATKEKANCQIVRCDDPEFTFEVTWTLDDARNAGLLGKDVWKKYPRAMLKARAISECAREACEDALGGVRYTPDELGAVVDDDENVIDGELITTVGPNAFAAPEKPKPDVPAAKLVRTVLDAFCAELGDEDGTREAGQWWSANVDPEASEPKSFPRAEALTILTEAKAAAVAAVARRDASAKTAEALKGGPVNLVVVEDLAEWDLASQDGAK